MEPHELNENQKFYFDPKALIERCPFNKSILRLLLYENYLKFYGNI